jgi:hypothetical protein
MSNPPRQTYKIAGAATWELIRAGYLAGDSARALAERYGVSEHAIRKRITIERWTKRDYAAALEARGLPAREPRSKTLNEAERFAAQYVAAPAPPEPEHPFMELVAALKQASAVAEDAHEHARDAEAARPPLEQAEDLERRALAQAAAAVLKGRASDAKALGALAEQMRKRVADEKEAAAEIARAAAAEATRERQGEEERLVGNLRAALKLAYCMVHNAQAAPAIYLDSVARVRREAFGEGTEESVERAYEEAQRARHYFGLDEDAWEAAWDAIVGEGEGEAVGD